ncbi:glycine betaine ABC transporter substrate-binding protein [Pelomicrobium sp.]|uniref:glycine betaine ABC transporter substrate-binding protein n=1 Tax=Pelomicrobium sp. TaxID=2815319 RepID=UPI002FDDA43E
MALTPFSQSVVAETLIVGSKRFTESYILGEIVRQTAVRAGQAALHRPGLGNTAIVFEAIKSGAIDLYPDYTGTLSREILGSSTPLSLAELNLQLAPYGLAVGIPLGFNNTYALAVREDVAEQRGLQRISDLVGHPDLRLGLSQEFLGRRDGWPGLKEAYGLPFSNPRGLDHGLAYAALAAGQVDVIDVYTTDAQLTRYRLRVLEDDRKYFPSYEAVLVYRTDVPRRFPKAWQALEALAGTIPASTMVRLNAEAELAGRRFADVAAGFLGDRGAAGSPPRERSLMEVLAGPDLARLTLEHVLLVFGSLVLSTAIGIPLGVAAQRAPRLGAAVLATVGVVQTIPALALLAFLIAALQRIGVMPALVALVLYGLLPIVRNTHAGLQEVPQGIRQSATALGLSPPQRLGLIELPLAGRAILGGIKTSAVINVGTATIAAFIGAGGYGERIVAGLALNDQKMLLAGAIPAAVFALLVQGLFDLLERRWYAWAHSGSGASNRF